MLLEDIEKNPVLNLSFQFAIQILRYCDKLETERKYIIARQLLKAGTSIGANVMEAQNPESKADFIHKMKIAAKESDETQYWLLLCVHTYNHTEPKELLVGIDELNRLLGSIITSAKRKHPFSYLLSLFM